MNFKGLRVLVLDGYGRQIPSILKQLHDLECVVTTVSCSQCDPGYASRYPQKRILSAEFKENNAVMEEVIDRELCSGAYDAVIPVLEPSTNFIVKNAEKYGQFVKIAAAPYEAFIMAYDKEETLRVCQRIGVPCPLTKMDDETLEEYLLKVQFPLALKPRKGTGSIGFHKVESREELYDLIQSGKVVPEEYVIQEFIPQNDIQYVNYMVIDGDGVLKSSLVAEKLRWYPVDGGSASLLRATDRKDIEQMSLKLLQAIHWTGYCQVGYINDPRNDTPKILEINGRIPASIRLCHLCGINVIQQMLELAFGEKVTPYMNNTNIGISLRYFQTDVLWLIESKVSFKEKLAWFNFKKNYDYIFSIRDPWPFFAYTFKGIFRFKKEKKKRKR